jgi:hypothetical protein
MAYTCMYIKNKNDWRDMFKGNVLRFLFSLRFFFYRLYVHSVECIYVVNDAYLLSAVTLFRDIIILINDNVVSIVCNIIYIVCKQIHSVYCHLKYSIFPIRHHTSDIGS